MLSRERRSTILTLRFSRPNRSPLSPVSIAAILLLVLSACEEPPDAEPNQEQIHQLQQEQERLKEVEQEVAQAHEETLTARQTIALIAGLGIAATVLALVIGTGIGSKARTDSEKKPKGDFTD